MYERATTRMGYIRLCVNCITRIRSEAAELRPSSSKGPAKEYRGSHPSQSHAATLGGAAAARTSFTVNRLGSSAKNKPLVLKGDFQYYISEIL